MKRRLIPSLSLGLSFGFSLNLLISSFGFADQVKDYQYFCENPSDSDSATYTVLMVRDHLAYVYHLDMNASCSKQADNLKSVDEIGINALNGVIDTRVFANLPKLKKLAIPKKTRFKIYRPWCLLLTLNL